jgi:hypothetical protein
MFIQRNVKDHSTMHCKVSTIFRKVVVVNDDEKGKTMIVSCNIETPSGAI